MFQQPKSVTAAAAVQSINPHIRIDAHQYKVGPETTATVYTDNFFQSCNVIVNALVCTHIRMFRSGIMWLVFARIM